jgi:hypothetical protein
VDAPVLLGDLERFLEQAVVGAHDDVGVHLDEAAVGIPGKARVAAGPGEAFDGGVVQAEVEHGVHHPGHRHARARADRHQQRHARTGDAEATAGGLLDMGNPGADLAEQPGAQLAALRVVGEAFLGGDGEARGYGQADPGHLGEIGALAAGDGLVAAARIVVPGTAAEGVDRLHVTFRCFKKTLEP